MLNLGDLHPHVNGDRTFGTPKAYVRVLVYNGDLFETLLLTDSEIKRLRARVDKNPEDSIQPTLWDRLAALFRRKRRDPKYLNTPRNLEQPCQEPTPPNSRGS